GMTLVAAVAVTPVTLLSGQRIDPGSAGDWARIAALAVGSGGLGHLLISWAHDHVDLSTMSLLTLAVPVVAAVSAALFLDERIVGLQVLGMAIVVCALGTVVLRETGRAPDNFATGPTFRRHRSRPLGHRRRPPRLHRARRRQSAVGLMLTRWSVRPRRTRMASW